MDNLVTMQGFISYSTKDLSLYTALCLAFDETKIDRWDVESMSPSKSLAEQLREAIQNCHFCVFIATDNSIDSPWCLAELGAFWGLGREIFFLNAKSGSSDENLPPQFRGYFWTANTQKLIESIKASNKCRQPLAPDKPGNAFWLGSDLQRAIRIASSPKDDKHNLVGTIRQVLHHLGQLGVDSSVARGQLIEALVMAEDLEGLSLEKRKRLVDLLHEAKSEFGAKLGAMQTEYRTTPLISEQNKLDQELKEFQASQ